MKVYIVRKGLNVQRESMKRAPNLLGVFSSKKEAEKCASASIPPPGLGFLDYRVDEYTLQDKFYPTR